MSDFTKPDPEFGYLPHFYGFLEVIDDSPTPEAEAFVRDFLAKVAKGEDTPLACISAMGRAVADFRRQEIKDEHN